MSPNNKEQPFAEKLCFMGTNKLAPVTDYPNDENSDNGLSSDRDENGKKSRPSHYRDQSHIRVPGGKAAAPKPITADYDDDDARIVELKQMGYSDNYIAKKLADEGRVRYQARTVTTRWLRLRKALEEKEEEILDDELSDWHEGEDELLKTCIDHVNAKLEKDIAKLKATLWKKVSMHFADVQQKKKYTGKACAERWDALLSGTADLPIELDPDKAGRARAREARIIANKARRAQAADELQRIEHEKREAKLAKARAVKKFKDLRAAAAEEKVKQAEIYRKMKASGVAARKCLKQTRNEWLDYNKVEIQWLRSKAKAQAAMRENFGDAHLSTKYVGDSDVEDEGENQDKDHFADQRIDPGIDNSSTTTGSGEKRNRETTSGSENEIIYSAKKTRISSGNATSAKSSGKKFKSKSTTPKQTFIPIGTAPVTTETLINPRSILTLDELEDLLLDRDLEKPGKNESHPQVVARLAAEDQLLTPEPLDFYMRKYVVLGRRGGKKQDKIRTIQESNASASAAGQAGVKSTDLSFKQSYEGYQIKLSTPDTLTATLTSDEPATCTSTLTNGKPT